METSGFWKEKGTNNSKNHIGLNLTLAFGAVVGSAAGKKDTPDGGLAEATRLASAQVNAVFELEEAAHAVGINVVGNGGAA